MFQIIFFSNLIHSLLIESCSSAGSSTSAAAPQPISQRPGKVELLVEDPEIGPILLDDTFEVEMHAAHELQWRKVSYEEAKESIDAAFDAFGSPKNAIGKPDSDSRGLRATVSPLSPTWRRCDECRKSCTGPVCRLS